MFLRSATYHHAARTVNGGRCAVWRRRGCARQGLWRTRARLPVAPRSKGTGWIPDAESLEFLGELALRLPGGAKPQAMDYARLLDSIQDRPDKHLIQTVLLRSMSQAQYSAQNLGQRPTSFDIGTRILVSMRPY